MTIFRPAEEARLRELFAGLERPVELLLALGPESTPLPGARDLDFGGEATHLVQALAALSEAVSALVEGSRPGSSASPRSTRGPRRGHGHPL